MIRIGAAMLLGLVVGVLTSGGVTASDRRVTENCIFNDDCVAPLVCGNGHCRVQCRSERDCGMGEECQREGANSRCVQTVPPAPPGELYGRVERGPGMPVRDCRIRVVGGPSATCDFRGEFRLPGLEAGSYELAVQSSGGELAPRTVTAWVESGAHSCVGAITLAARADVVAIDETIDPAVFGGGGGYGKGGGSGKGGEGGKDKPPTK